MAIDDVEGVEPAAIEVGEEASYVTQGRVDPTYALETQQYHAPVAETRSFWSRFWWLFPLLILLIVLPFLLHRCNRAEACAALPSTVWTSAQQETTWSQVVTFDNQIFTPDQRTQVLDELVYLCNKRLTGNVLVANEVANHLEYLNVTPAVASNLIELVNGGSFCRCR